MGYQRPTFAIPLERLPWVRRVLVERTKIKHLIREPDLDLADRTNEPPRHALPVDPGHVMVFMTG